MIKHFCFVGTAKVVSIIRTIHLIFKMLWEYAHIQFPSLFVKHKKMRHTVITLLFKAVVHLLS